VLIDVVSGEISALEWKKGAEDVLESLPVKDSILAIADESYFDWPVLPEAPSGLIARSDGNSIVLSWAIHGGDTKSSVLERRAGNGPWTSLSTQPVSRSEYADADFPTGQTLSYRVSAVNDSGCSAYSNIVRVER